MQITADVSKFSKTFQRDLSFIFDVLSESLFGFVSYSVFYNQLHNILRLFDVLPNFPFTTSETIGDCYL